MVALIFIPLTVALSYGIGWVARWGIGQFYPPALLINVWAFTVVIWILMLPQNPYY